MHGPISRARRFISLSLPWGAGLESSASRRRLHGRLLVLLASIAGIGGVLAQTSSPAAPGCYQGRCEVASRRPFVGFLISGRLPNTSGVWFPGGDLIGALEAHRSNVNFNLRNGIWPGNCQTVDSYTPLGSAPATSTGGPWRSVFVTRASRYGGQGVAPSCSPPAPYSSTDVIGAISGICGEGNSSGLITGIDDACYCPAGWNWSDIYQRCVIVKDRWKFPPPNTCNANPGQGNPIFPLSGSKRQVVSLGLAIGHESAQLAYDTAALVPYAAGSGQVNGKAGYLPFLNTGLPNPWASSLHKGLAITAHGIQAHRGGGQWVSFARSGNSATPAAGVRDRLLASGAGWRYEDQASGAVEVYDGAGRILSAANHAGSQLTYQYSDSSTPVTQAPTAGLLIGITDQQGRNVSFHYDSSSRLTQVTASDGSLHGLAYDNNGSLARLTWPDGTSQQFLYERNDLPWALTGLVDEAQQRTASYGYSAAGLAISTVKHGPGGAAVDAYSVNYPAASPGWTVTEDFSSPPVLWRDHTFVGAASLTLTSPTGAISVMSGSTLNGAPKLTGQSQPAGSGCAAATSSQAYDSNGNRSSTDDFNGVRTCFAHDPSRNLETARVEGLAAGTPCTLTATGVALPAGSRKVSTQWHPHWPLKTRVAEPGRITTSVFNGQPDPYAGGAAASCAPANALLPDGKPIAVLCRQVEQATTDGDGSAGFAAPAQPNVALREQRWTYNARGQVLTHDGPRSDIADITSYEYYGDTTFSGTGSAPAGHTQGDLMRVTNPAGHVTQHTLYDRAGRLRQSVDPNGVVTDLAYDARGRVISSSVGGQSTQYAWWPTGLIQQVSSPDGSWTFYEHDAARRLWRVSDHLGRSVTYTLDATGQRTAETVTDPDGSLRRQVARTIDALGRIEQITGRE